MTDLTSIHEHDVLKADGTDGYYLDHESNLANSRLKLSWVARDLPAGKQVRDAGYLLGHFSNPAADRYDGTGFDISPMAVARSQSQEHFRVPSFVGLIYGLPDILGEFDTVCSWNVIEHLPIRLGSLNNSDGSPSGWAASSGHRQPGRTGSWAALALDPGQHINLFSALDGTATCRHDFEAGHL